jgi:RNA polymerase sigma factor (sigma-70 family)
MDCVSQGERTLRSLVDTETDRIERLLAGDERAAEELLARYKRQLRSVVHFMGVPDAVSEDVLQEVWMDVWRQLRAGRFRGECAFATWLGTIARGKVVDYRRHRDASRSDAMVAIDAESRDEPARLSVPADQEALAAAERALDAMGARLQLAFRMRYRQGLDVPAIARMLGLSNPRTYALLARARDEFCQSVLGSENSPLRTRPMEKKDACVRRDGALPTSAAE